MAYEILKNIRNIRNFENAKCRKHPNPHTKLHLTLQNKDLDPKHELVLYRNSYLGPDGIWIHIGQRTRIRIGKPDLDPTGQNRPPKKGKMNKYHVWRVLCWPGGFFWSLNVLCRGLRRHVGRIRIQQTVGIRIRKRYLQARIITGRGYAAAAGPPAARPPGRSASYGGQLQR